VRISGEFEMPGERVLIHREGERLIIEPVKTPDNMHELLIHQRREGPLGAGDDIPPSRIFAFRQSAYSERLSTGHKHNE
jgi:virulence-associated protein VagC